MKKENGCLVDHHKLIIMKPIYTIMFFLSLSVFVVSLVALMTYGLNFGVDFKGGSVLEIKFSNNYPSVEEITTALKKTAELAEKDLIVNSTGERGFIVRTDVLSESEHQNILIQLKSVFKDSGLTEQRFDSVGPVVGRELRNKSFMAIVIMLIVIMGYIALVFRKLSKTLSLWVMNMATVVGLLHDIVIPLGLFAVLGHFFDVQIGAIFVAAILTILGYTVSDKVVIFDRVRENILRGSREDLGTIVHQSVMQTLVRSINNTLTVLLSSLAIFLFGGESIKYFALALIVGIFWEPILQYLLHHRCLCGGIGVAEAGRVDGF